MSQGPRLVSVVIPTFRRPDELRLAVTSVLNNRLPQGWDLEVVVVRSDPHATPDAQVAEELAADPRVRVTVTRGWGRGASRNAGLAAARGEVVAFTDDDCQADPEWLAIALKALEDADIVQGRTIPARPPQGLEKTMSVTPPSWLWETCNLMVRREWVDRAGGFSEHWVVGGEDTEWGWKMVRRGARAAFADDAVVRHAVLPRTFAAYLVYKAGIANFPRLFRTTPEARRVFYRRVFVDRRHVDLAGAGTLGLIAGVAGLASRRMLRNVALGAGAALYLHPVDRSSARHAWEDLRFRVPVEAVEFSAALYGSVRWRRLLL